MIFFKQKLLVFLVASIIILVFIPNHTKALTEGLGGWQTSSTLYDTGTLTDYWKHDWTPGTYTHFGVGSNVYYFKNLWHCDQANLTWCDGSNGGILISSTEWFALWNNLPNTYTVDWPNWSATYYVTTPVCGSYQIDSNAGTSSDPASIVPGVVGGFITSLGNDCPGVAPACDANQLNMSVTPNPGTVGANMTFSLSGTQGSTYVDDVWSGGVNCSGGFWGDKICGATAAGDPFTWTHNWKNCAPGDCSITSAQCTKSINYSVDTPTCAAPATPTLSSPVSGTSSPNVNPIFTWLKVSIPAGCASRTYQIQVRKHTNTGTLVINTSGISNANKQCNAGSASCPFQNGGITPGDTYYWHVRATTTGGSSTYSSYWTYIVPACPVPATPNLVSPTNGTSSAITTPTLDWSDVTTPAGCASKTYEVQINQASASGTLVVNSTGLTTSTCATGSTCPFTNGGIVPGYSYYWKARAVTTGGPSAWSAPWIYTVPGNVAPAIVSATIDHSPTGHTPNAVVPDDSKIYSITLTGTDANGGNDITGMYALINLQGENINNYRGRVGWSSVAFTQNFTLVLGTNVNCVGGGQAGKNTIFGEEYINIVGCSTSTNINTRTTVINVSFHNPHIPNDPNSFPNPSDNDISMQIYDQAGLFADWVNFNTDFNFVLPPTSLNGTCNANGTQITWDWTNHIDGQTNLTPIQYYGHRLTINDIPNDIPGSTRNFISTGLTPGNSYSAQVQTLGDNNNDQNSVLFPLFPNPPVSITCPNTSASPWWQVLGGDITAFNGSITSPNTPGGSFLMDSWNTIPPGLAIASGSIGTGIRNPSDWKATGSVLSTQTITYETLRDKIKSSIPSSIPDAGNLSITNVSQILTNGNARTDANGYTYLWSTGYININPPTLDVGANKIVLLADSSVTISSNISLDESNGGFFMILTNGPLVINGTVGKTSFIQTPDLEGVYFSQSNISLLSSSNFLRIEGSVISMGPLVTNIATRTPSNLSNYPVLQFVFRPDQVVLIPNSASISKLLWQEVAP